jgi:hypothetical protein
MVANYFKGKGIPADRIVVDCKGETMPAYDNTKELGKELNRRVEIKLTGDANDYAVKKLTIDSVANSNALENKSTLIKNFPNPFQGTTTLEAFVRSDVKDAVISIQDLNGKLVKTIHLLERGNTTVNFDALSLSKGLYTATLITDNVTSNTLKMLLQ